MKFLSVVQIDTIYDLIALNRLIKEKYPRGIRAFDDLISQFAPDYNDVGSEASEYLKKEFQPKEFVPGIYFVWVEDSWDRMGNNHIEILHLIPEKPVNIKVTTENLRKLFEENEGPAEMIAQLQQAMRNKNKEKVEELQAKLTDRDFDIVQNFPRKAEEIGIGLW